MEVSSLTRGGKSLLSQSQKGESSSFKTPGGEQLTPPRFREASTLLAKMAELDLRVSVYNWIVDIFRGHSHRTTVDPAASQ